MGNFWKYCANYCDGFMSRKDGEIFVQKARKAKQQEQMTIIIQNGQEIKTKGLLGGATDLKQLNLQEYQYLVKQYTNFVFQVQKRSVDLKFHGLHGINKIKYQQKLVQQAENNHKIVIKNYVLGDSVSYNVYISKFEISVKVKIINQNTNLDEADIFRSGGFGQIFLLKKQKMEPQKTESQTSKLQIILKQSTDQNVQCLKVVNFKKQKSAPYLVLKNMIKQIAISKIASAFDIGPRIYLFDQFSNKPDEKYDLVVFNDAICYKMEKCVPLIQVINQSYWQYDSNAYKIKLYERMDNQLAFNLVLLHSLKIVHRDIKTDNILYSRKRNKFILCDYGISHSVHQQPQKRSRIYQLAGTKGYMYPQLQRFFNVDVTANVKQVQNNQNKTQKINKTRHFYANFYINDLFAYKKTLINLHQLIFNKKISLQQLGDSLRNNQKLTTLRIPNINKPQTISLQLELKFLRMFYGYNFQVEQKWRNYITQLSKNNKQLEQAQKTKLEKYTNKFKSIVKQEKQQMIQIQIIQRNRGFNKTLFGFNEFENIKNQIINQTTNYVNILKSYVYFLKRLSNKPQIQKLFPKYVEIFQNRQENRTDMFEYDIQPQSNYYSSKQGLIYCKILRILVYFFSPNNNSNHSSLLNKLEINLHQLNQFYKSRSTILFMDELVISTSTEDFGDFIMKKAVKLRKMNIARDKTQKQLDKFLYGSYQETINKNNFLQYEQIAMLYVRAAYEALNCQNQKAKQYCSIASQILMNIQHVTNNNQKHYSCCGIILLVHHILSFLERSPISFKDLLQTQQVIKQTYGTSSFYHLECVFLKMYYSQKVVNYEQIFMRLFQTSKYDYNFKVWVQTKTDMNKTQDIIYKQSQLLENFHYSIIDQLRLTQKIFPSYSQKEQRKNQQQLKQASIQVITSLYKKFVNIMFPHFNLFDIKIKQRSQILDIDDYDYQKMKQFPSYKRFIISYGFLITSKEKYYQQNSQIFTKNSPQSLSQNSQRLGFKHRSQY